MTQCASSTTKRESSRSRCSRTSAFCSATLCVSRSGVTSSTLVASGRAFRLRRISDDSSLVCVEFMWTAAIPAALSARHWSCMSESSGTTSSVSPSLSSAGIW